MLYGGLAVDLKDVSISVTTAISDGILMFNTNKSIVIFKKFQKLMYEALTLPPNGNHFVLSLHLFFHLW